MKVNAAILLLVILVCFSVPVGATLIDRGAGMIYDTDQGITWLQDANYARTSGYSVDGRMTWEQANVWAAGLTFGGYGGWRLPTTVHELYTFGYDGTTNAGYNTTTSEMAYMFYENLGNSAYIATDGTYPQPDWGLTNTGPFINLQSNLYWSATPDQADPADATYFDFSDGSIWVDYQGLGYFAWAVRDGDVAPVPEPSTIVLMGLGLVGLAGFGRKKLKG